MNRSIFHRAIGLGISVGLAVSAIAKPAFAEKLKLPERMHCEAAVCTEGLPKCATEANGNLLTINGLTTKKPTLSFDGRPAIAPFPGGVESSFLTIDRDVVKFEFKYSKCSDDGVRASNEQAVFKFNRSDLLALADGKAPTISGSYQRVDKDSSIPLRARLLVTCTSTVPAIQPPKPPTPVQTIAESCAACHGENGISTMDGVPQIAGQKLPMMVASLRDYKIGARNDNSMKVMNEAVKDLTEEDLQAISTLYAGMERPQKATKPNQLARPANINSCCACHSAKGNMAGYSLGDVYLGGQSEEYLTKEMTDIQSGVRSMFVMRFVAHRISPEDQANIISYFASSTPENACTN